MALHFMLFGSRLKPTAHIKMLMGLWNPFNQRLWKNPPSVLPSSSCYLFRRGSSIPNSPTTFGFKSQDDGGNTVLCRGASIYEGAQKDDWIISLAKFAVEKHNEN